MIVSSRIIEDRLQAHGQRYVREVHTDHLGRKHPVSYATEGDTDVDKIMKNRITQLSEQLVNSEIQEVCDLIESGKSIPRLEFTDIEKIKTEAANRKAERESEIIDVTQRKSRLEEII